MENAINNKSKEQRKVKVMHIISNGALAKREPMTDDERKESSLILKNQGYTGKFLDNF